MQSANQNQADELSEQENRTRTTVADHQDRVANEGEDMGFNVDRAREVHFTRMQKALEEGLKAIEAARTPDEADAARLRAQARMEELNHMWEDAFPKQEAI